MAVSHEESLPSRLLGHLKAIWTDKPSDLEAFPFQQANAELELNSAHLSADEITRLVGPFLHPVAPVKLVERCSFLQGVAQAFSVRWASNALLKIKHTADGESHAISDALWGTPASAIVKLLEFINRDLLTGLSDAVSSDDESVSLRGYSSGLASFGSVECHLYNLLTAIALEAPQYIEELVPRRTYEALATRKPLGNEVSVFCKGFLLAACKRNVDLAEVLVPRIVERELAEVTLVLPVENDSLRPTLLCLPTIENLLKDHGSPGGKYARQLLLAQLPDVLGRLLETAPQAAAINRSCPLYVLVGRVFLEALKVNNAETTMFVLALRKAAPGYARMLFLIIQVNDGRLRQLYCDVMKAIAQRSLDARMDLRDFQGSGRGVLFVTEVAVLAEGAPDWLVSAGRQTIAVLEPLPPFSWRLRRAATERVMLVGAVIMAKIAICLHGLLSSQEVPAFWTQPLFVVAASSLVVQAGGVLLPHGSQLLSRLLAEGGSGRQGLAAGDQSSREAAAIRHRMRLQADVQLPFQEKLFVTGSFGFWFYLLFGFLWFKKADVAPAAVGLGGEDEECAVCKEAFLPGALVSSLACGHVFHLSCANSWFRQTLSCPLCRREVTDQEKDVTVQLVLSPWVHQYLQPLGLPSSLLAAVHDYDVFVRLQPRTDWQAQTRHAPSRAWGAYIFVTVRTMKVILVHLSASVLVYWCVVGWSLHWPLWVVGLPFLLAVVSNIHFLALFAWFWTYHPRSLRALGWSQLLGIVLRKTLWFSNPVDAARLDERQHQANKEARKALEALGLISVQLKAALSQHKSLREIASALLQYLDRRSAFLLARMKSIGVTMELEDRCGFPQLSREAHKLFANSRREVLAAEQEVHALVSAGDETLDNEIMHPALVRAVCRILRTALCDEAAYVNAVVSNFEWVPQLRADGGLACDILRNLHSRCDTSTSSIVTREVSSMLAVLAGDEGQSNANMFTFLMVSGEHGELEAWAGKLLALLNEALVVPMWICDDQRDDAGVRGEAMMSLVTHYLPSAAASALLKNLASCRGIPSGVWLRSIAAICHASAPVVAAKCGTRYRAARRDILQALTMLLRRDEDLTSAITPSMRSAIKSRAMLGIANPEAQAAALLLEVR